MDKTQNKPTLTKKRILESHEESGSKKGIKRLKLGKTEAESEETRLKKIMEFKDQGQKLTEKEKSQKVLLKKLQKLRRSGDEPMSKVTMTTVKMERKEVKTELSAAPVIKDRMHETGESSLKPQEVGMKTGENKRKMSQTEGCVNKDDLEWYQENVSDALDQLKNGLLQDEQLHTLVDKFTSEICRSMQRIRLQPEIGLAEIQDIVNMVTDKDGTALKSFLKGELVLSKEVWQQLINLKFGVTVNRDEQSMKQLKEGIYTRNAKSPEEESYLRSKIAYMFKHRSKAHAHNAKAAVGLAELAQQMDSLSNFYVVTQAATVNGIVINSPSIDRMLTEQKNSKNRPDELLQEYFTSKAVEETCLPLMREDWIDKSFKPT